MKAGARGPQGIVGQGNGGQVGGGNPAAPALPLPTGGHPVDPAMLLAASPPRATPIAPPASTTTTSASQMIEPGRALALADFSPPSVSMGERLIRLAYKVGIPGSVIASPLGRPAKLKLMATAANPLPGDKVAGTALRAGHFLIHGLKLPISSLDFAGENALTPPVARVLHGFHWLADLEAAGPRELVSPVAERILASWLAANCAPPSRPGKVPAWSVGHAGSRLLNWLVHAPLVLSGADKVLRGKLLAAMAETARWLDRHVTRAEDGLAQVAGWSAIVAAGLLLPDGHPRRLYGEAGLIHALGELVGDDGGLLSRSPLGQMEAIALLVKLSACYRATRRDPPNAVEAMIALLVPPLLVVTHGDGSLGSWQGGWAVDAEAVVSLVAATGIRTRPLREVRQWGYQRATGGKSIVMFDAAPPPLPDNARNGCASTLAIEFSHAGQRLVVNCGGAAAAGGTLPLALEQGLRATAAHSTLTLDDVNSTAVLPNGRLGGGVSEVEVDRRLIEGDNDGGPGGRGGNRGATRLEASHDGYAGRYGVVHRRILLLRDDGSELRGEDLLVPAGRKAKRGLVGFALRFHLGPGISVGISEDRQGAGLALPDGSYWQFRSGGGEVSVEESIWADGQGRPVPIQQLVIQGMAPRSGTSFAWLFKKMG